MTPSPVASLPTPRLLGSLSPSRFTAIEACILKETCGGNAKLLPRYPKGFLGTIAHRMVEMGAKGLLTGKQGDPAAMWDKLVAEAEIGIAQDSIEAHLAPLKRSCAEYGLIRARTIRAASQLAASGPLSGGAGSTAAEGLGYEIGVSSKDGAVKGRIDAVTVIEGVLTISDYKTGAVLLEEGGLTQIKPEYETQLKLYAAIYYETYGRWLDRLLLLNLQGSYFEIPFSRPECEHLLEIAKDTLQKTNDRIRMALQQKDALPLANPSPKTCRFCTLRPGCKAYCEARHAQLDAEWPHDLWGRIETKTVSSLGLWAACLNDSSAHGEKAVIRRLSGGTRHPQFQEAAPGVTIAAFGLRKEGCSETYTESPTTVVYRLH
jgi:CRISPR/Cas system-associated exonuclease Cas4 (RecB family)